MLLAWESFGEDVRGVVVGVDIVVPDDRSYVKVAAVVIVHINVFRTSLGDPGGDVLGHPANRCRSVAVR